MMKKRWLISILAAIMSFSLVACADDEGKNNSDNSGGNGDSSSQEQPITPEVETVDITIPVNGVGYAVTGESTAVKGENYSFSVTLARGYEKAENFAVKVNGIVVVEDLGVYTVNASEDLVITVEGIALKMCDVLLTSGAGYVVTGEATVQFGSEYEFTVTVDETMYQRVDFAVKVNGKLVEESEDGRYVITALEDKITITVEGVVISPYIRLEDNEFENKDQWWIDDTPKDSEIGGETLPY